MRRAVVDSIGQHNARNDEDMLRHMVEARDRQIIAQRRLGCNGATGGGVRLVDHHLLLLRGMQISSSRSRHWAVKRALLAVHYRPRCCRYYCHRDLGQASGAPGSKGAEARRIWIRIRGILSRKSLAPYGNSGRQDGRPPGSDNGHRFSLDFWRAS